MKLFESGIFYIHQRKTGDSSVKWKTYFLEIERTI